MPVQKKVWKFIECTMNLLKSLRKYIGGLTLDALANVLFLIYSPPSFDINQLSQQLLLYALIHDSLFLFFLFTLLLFFTDQFYSNYADQTRWAPLIAKCLSSYRSTNVSRSSLQYKYVISSY